MPTYPQSKTLASRPVVHAGVLVRRGVRAPSAVDEHGTVCATEKSPIERIVQHQGHHRIADACVVVGIFLEIIPKDAFL